MLDDVRLLWAGYCKHPQAMTLAGGSWLPARYPAGFALIRHRREGAILFDTGYSEHFLAESHNWMGFLYSRVTPVRLDPAQTASRQVARLGVNSGEVRHIIVSHFHADHVAGLRDFPAARIWCTRVAWKSIFRRSGLAALTRGFLPGLLPTDIEQRLSFINDCPPATLPAYLRSFGPARDLFADGAMLALDLPGHGVGQAGLFLPAAPHQPLFLVADAAWSRQAIATGAPVPRLSTAFLGDVPAYRATLLRLHELQQAMPSLAIVPSHDPPSPGTLPHP